MALDLTYDPDWKPARPQGAADPAVALDLTYDPAWTPSKRNTGLASDLATDLKRGAQKLPGALTGLADIPVAALTGERYVSRAADALGEATGFQPGKWADAAADEYSPQRKAGAAAIERAWQHGSAGDIAGAYLRNPGNVAGLVAESIPSILAGGLVGRAALAGAARLAPTAAAAPIAPVVAGAAGEGAMIAGQTMESISDDVDPRRAAAAAAAAGLAGSALGVAGGAFARRLGVIDPETALAGGVAATGRAPMGLTRRLAGGATAEGLLQEMPQSVTEQALQNWAEEKPLGEGVARAAVEGTMAGGLIGAGANVMPVRGQQNPTAGPLSKAARMAQQANASALAQQQQLADEEGGQIAGEDPRIAAAQQAKSLQARAQADALAAERARTAEQAAMQDAAADEIAGATGFEDQAETADFNRFVGQEAQDLTERRARAADNARLERAGVREEMRTARDQLTAEGAFEAEQRARDRQRYDAAAMPFERILPEDFDTLNPIRAGQGEVLDAERPPARGLPPPEQQGALPPPEDRGAGALEYRPQPSKPLRATADGQVGTPQQFEELDATRAVRREQMRVARERARFVNANAEARAARTVPYTEQTAQREAERLSNARQESFTVVPHPVREDRFAAVPARSIAKAPHDAAEPAQRVAPRGQEGERTFAPETGTLGIPRAEMPQVPSRSHGGLVKHLNAQGIAHETTNVDAASLKPTQAEYSPEKVEAAKTAAGDRAVIVSNDGHIVDGHHQSMAAAEEGKQIKAIVLDAPIDQALEAVKNSPSAQAETSAVAERASAPTKSAAEPPKAGEGKEAGSGNVIDDLMAMEKGAGQGFKSNDRAIEVIRRATQGMDAQSKAKVSRTISKFTAVERDGTRLIKPGFYEAVAEDFAYVNYMLRDAMQDAPEFTTLKDRSGNSVTVRTADLSGARERMPMFTKDGKRKATWIHRDNLDPTGEKQSKNAKEMADNPLFNVITTKGGGAFAIKAAAQRELNARGLAETHEVVPAGDVQAGMKGYLVRKKAEAPAATHKDPGQPAEPVTQPVIAEAIQKSARNTDFNPAEAKAWILGEIDKAIAVAPTADRIFDGVKIADKPATYAGVKTWSVDGPKDADGLTPSLNIEQAAGGGFAVVWGKSPDQAVRAPNLELAKEDAARIVKTGKFVVKGKVGSWQFDATVLDAKEFVAFDVPGDGKFKVVNTVEKLRDFRAKVEKSPGFAKSPDRPMTYGSGMAGAINLDAEIRRIEGLSVVDRRYQGGDVLEEIGNAIEIARLKKSKDEGKLLDRFKEASKGKDYDAWRAEQEATEEIAAREAEAREQANQGDPQAFAEMMAMYDQPSEQAQQPESSEFKSSIAGVRQAYGDASAFLRGRIYSVGVDNQHKARLEARLVDAGLTKREASDVIASAQKLKAQETRGAGAMTFLQLKYVLRAASNRELIEPVDTDGRPVEVQQPEQPAQTPDAPPSAAEERAMEAELDRVPGNVQSRLSIALAALRETRDRLAGVMRARGKGQILAIEVRDAQDEIARRRAVLDEFRAKAGDNDIDADLVMRALGGEPDFTEFGEPAAAEAPALPPAANQPALAGPRRNPAQVSAFTPYAASDIVDIDGQDWQVQQDMGGWYLTSTGNWRGMHPAIQKIRGMNELIAEIERAATAQPATAEQGDAPAGAEATAADLLTPEQARTLMAWEDLGQRDNVKSMRLAFFESAERMAAKRGAMNYGTIESYQGGKWNIDGTTYPTLKAAKAAAEEAAIDRLRADGYVEKVRAEAEHPASDRDQFTVERVDEDQRQTLTFKRGETVKVSGKYPMETGQIDGISNARQEFKVGGAWLPFGYAYKAEYDEFAAPRRELEEMIANAEKRIADGSGFQRDGYPIRDAREHAKRYGLGGYDDTLNDLAKRGQATFDRSVAEDRARMAAAEQTDRERREAADAADAAKYAGPVKMTMDEWKRIGRDFKSFNGGNRTVMQDGRIRRVEIIKEKAEPAAQERTEQPAAEAPTAPQAEEVAGREQAQQPSEKIADFGEKIGGAKKDVWSGFKEKLGDVSDADIASEPLSKVWPQPDYQGLIDSGVDPWVAAFIRAARDEIPAKPRQSWKLKRWSDQVRELRSLAQSVMADVSLKGRARELFEKNQALVPVRGRVDLYMAVGHGKSLEGVRFGHRNYTFYKGQNNVSLWVVEQDAKATAWSNWPRELATGDTKEQALAEFKRKYDSLNINEPAARQVSFDIYSKHGVDGYFIGKKIGRNHLDLAGPFKTVKEAREHKATQHEALLDRLEKVKEIPRERRDTNEPRVGEDMRNGQDVTPEMFSDAFGFRGVEFGNWVEQGRRQKDLNDAYDALMDMAAVLGIPPKAVSLNGELGLAFGARGSGGKGVAAAHYEPGKVVINLTKKEGAGSLGHEWWHALDNYFSRMRNSGGYMTDALDVSLADRGSDFVANTKVRHEMIEAFGEVMRAIRSTALKARSQKLDERRTKEYWTTKPEMSARAFESYLISRLQDHGASNDYLANIVSEKTWQAAEAMGFELDSSYPYPTAGEIPRIRAAFDSFFTTIQSKETDKGVMLFSRGEGGVGLTRDALRQSIVDRFPRLAKSIDAMLKRGDEGQRGGVVVVERAEDLAGTFASKTGRTMDEARNALQMSVSPDGERSNNGDIQGFFDPKSGLTFMVAPNLTAETAPAVLFHEAMHGKQREEIDRKALQMIENRGTRAKPLREFLLRVAQRMEDAGEFGNSAEAASYIVEQAVTEGRQAGFSAIDGKLLNWIDATIGKPVGDLVRGFVAMVRAWALRKGFNFEPSVDDLVAIARSNLQQMARGDATGGERVQASRLARSPSTITAAWESPEPSKLDSLIYTLQNKQVDMKRVVDAVKEQVGEIEDQWNPYLQEELFHGRSAKGVRDFLAHEMRPLLAEMRRSGVEMAELEKFLHSRHAPEANAHIAKINPNEPDLQDGGSGMTNKEAADHLASIAPDRRRTLDALAKQIDTINASTRKLMVDSGLETAETIKAWEAAYKNYVPLQREDVEAGGLGIGQGFSVRGPASKRRTGSKKAVIDILANIALQREKTIVRAEKNRVAQANYALAIKAPNPDFWMPVNPDEAKAFTPAQQAKMASELVSMGLDPADAQNFVKEPVQRYVDPRTGLVAERINPVLRGADNVLALRIEGKDRFVFFNRKDDRAQRMVHALKNLDADQLGHVFGVLAKLTRFFAAVNTQWNPIFGVVNLTRDTQAALLQLSTTPIRGSEKAVLKNVLPAMRGIYAALRAEREGRALPNSPWAKAFDEFRNEGGQTGYRDMFSNSQERADALAKELNPEGWMDSPLGKVFTANGVLRVPMARAQQMAGGLFNWLTDYNDTLENAVRLSAYMEAKAKGLSSQEAASVAKNLTVNFNRKGQIATQAGALYAFFNAAMQGTTRMLQTLKGPAGRKIILGGLTLGALQAVTLAAAGFDDEEPPEFVRERSIVIPLGDGKYASIPMPLGFHVIPSTSRILTEWALSGFRDTTKRFGDFVALFADTFNPIGNAGWSMQTLAPTALDPVAALAENRDWTGKPIAQQDFNSLRPTPGHARARDTASELSKALAYWVNLATGGTDYKPGLISPTPDQIDYLIGQITGGVGREYLKAEQTAMSLWTGEDLPPHKIPLLGRFYGDTTGQSSEATRFYNNLRDINLHRAEIEGRRKDGGDVQGYLRDNPEARIGMAGPIQVEGQVRKLREAKRTAVERGDAARVRAIDGQITTAMRRFNERVSAAAQ
ncbi:LPD38 domain-containing protein [Thauera sp.]|uniref:LPD38 domain-containing protein n=1 Tax=Thauera sp. TaxID=1905334 RepID=UPI0026166295|nr:LPD38 domain-containing protein [Thauera sp.]